MGLVVHKHDILMQRRLIHFDVSTKNRDLLLEESIFGPDGKFNREIKRCINRQIQWKRG
jgi:hypothetical protein